MNFVKNTQNMWSNLWTLIFLKLNLKNIFNSIIFNYYIYNCKTVNRVQLNYNFNLL